MKEVDWKALRRYVVQLAIFDYAVPYNQADDVAQETILRIWRLLTGGRTVNVPFALAKVIARNLVINWNRKARRERTMSDCTADTRREDEEVDFPDPSDMEERVQLLCDLSRLRSSLPLLSWRERNAVLLAAWGFGQGEAAARMDVTVNCFRVRLHRGRRKLQALYAA